MTEQLISFETAKLAKEKGFVGMNKTTAYVPMYVDGHLTEKQGEDDDIDGYALAVPQSLLQKWLRDVHGMSIVVRRTSIDHNDLWLSYIQNVEDDFYADTYEEALEQGLQEALKLI